MHMKNLMHGRVTLGHLEILTSLFYFSLGFKCSIILGGGVTLHETFYLEMQYHGLVAIIAKECAVIFIFFLETLQLNYPKKNKLVLKLWYTIILWDSTNDCLPCPEPNKICLTKFGHIFFLLTGQRLAGVASACLASLTCISWQGSMRKAYIHFGETSLLSLVDILVLFN
ncbi:hypothetical protein ACJX0J_025139, partial [Zea mays]